MKNKNYDRSVVPARYLQRFIGLNSCEEFFHYKLFPNLKEITESMSLWCCIEDKICNWGDIPRSLEGVSIYVIGDGVTPRTAGLCAFLSKANCFSIDPKMRPRDYSGIKRLTVINGQIENHKFETEDIAIILLPHSHAPIQSCWDNIKAEKKWLVKMPCCTHDLLPGDFYSYKDKYNISGKNEVQIWCNYLTLGFNS